MFKYILKRLLFFIPTLFFITLFAFLLGKMAPGDPVNLRLKGGMSGSSTGQLSEKQAGEQAYYELSEKLGLNLPVFYFVPTSKAYPDSLYKIINKDERETMTDLIGKFGNWPEIEQYYHRLKALDIEAAKIRKDTLNFQELSLVRESIAELMRTPEKDKIDYLLNRINVNIQAEKEVQTDSATFVTLRPLEVLSEPVLAVNNAFELVQTNATPGKKLIPAIHWYGIKNQYHRWLFGDEPWFGKPSESVNATKGFFRGDFGTSITDGRPIISKLKDAIFWTLILNLIAVTISYIISIPLGVLNAVKKDTFVDKFSTVILFILYSLPSFWIATLIVVFFTTSHYADWMNILPTHGTGSNTLSDDASLWARISDSIPYLIAPIFCMTYGSFAYLSRQMRGGMLSVIRQDFIRTAKAKGLSNNKIIWKHAFRNSLIPIITIFAGLLPGMIGGSVVIESIFQIPGMGKTALDALFTRDYPMVFTIMIFASILTMLGVLISDILYAIVDPRISFSKKS
jgi:peptide/nickel transport system permease protein